MKINKNQAVINARSISYWDETYMLAEYLKIKPYKMWISSWHLWAKLFCSYTGVKFGNERRGYSKLSSGCKHHILHFHAAKSNPPKNPIRIFQAKGIGWVEVSIDENVLKCSWNRRQQPLLVAAYLTRGSTYVLPLEPRPYNILRRYSEEVEGMGRSSGRRRVLWERDRRMS